MGKTASKTLAIGVSGRSWLLNPFVGEAIKLYGKRAQIFDRTPHFISARNFELRMAASGRADARTAVRPVKLQRVDVTVHFQDAPRTRRGQHVASVTVSAGRRRRKNLSLALEADRDSRALVNEHTRRIMAAINEVLAS